MQQGPDSPVLSQGALHRPSAVLGLTRVSSPLVLVPAAALPWNPAGLRLWQRRSLCWLQRNKADASPRCSFSLEALLALAFAMLEARCAVGAYVLQQEQLSPFPGVAGCRLRGYHSARHGQVLPCLQLVPARGKEVPGPLPAPRQCEGCTGWEGDGW